MRISLWPILILAALFWGCGGTTSADDATAVVDTSHDLAIGDGIPLTDTGLDRFEQQVEDLHDSVAPGDTLVDDTAPDSVSDGQPATDLDDVTDALDGSIDGKPAPDLAQDTSGDVLQVNYPDFDYSAYLPTPFTLFWANPVRAHPGVPLLFRFISYELHNRSLNWELIGAPAGMTIDQQGSVSWTPAEADSGPHSITVRVTRSDGATIERGFVLTVGRDDFIFVASGSVGGDGTFEKPFGTISAAVQSLKGNDGKTILIRAGTYPESLVLNVDQRFYTPQDPLFIRGYPGEQVLIDGAGTRPGVSLFSTGHVLLSHLQIINALDPDRGGLSLFAVKDIIAHDIEVRDCHWPAGANVTGVLIQYSANVVLDRVVSHDNSDPSKPTFWNSTDFLFYSDEPNDNFTTYLGDSYLLNCTAYNSVVGFKIKHAGPRRLIIHNSIARGMIHGFALGSDRSSLRYSLAIDNDEGIHINMADPEPPYTTGSVLIEHNTVYNSKHRGLLLRTGHMMNGTHIRYNIFYNDIAPAESSGDPALNRLMSFWRWEVPDPYTLFSDHNLFYGLSQQHIIRFGSSDYSYSYSRWRSEMGYDSSSVFADPKFTAPANQNFGIPPDSPARFPDGSFAGAIAPK